MVMFIVKLRMGPQSNLGNWHTDRAGLGELGHPRLKVMVYLTPNMATQVAKQGWIRARRSTVV